MPHSASNSCEPNERRVAVAQERHEIETPERARTEVLDSPLSSPVL
jgi:hypothetical protein